MYLPDGRDQTYTYFYNNAQNMCVQTRVHCKERSYICIVQKYTRYRNHLIHGGRLILHQFYVHALKLPVEHCMKKSFKY